MLRMPAPSCSQFVDLESGYFFDYKEKKDGIIVRVYRLGKKIFKDYEIKRSMLEKLPLILPEGKKVAQLIAWILKQGFIPFIGPSGFKQKSNQSISWPQRGFNHLEKGWDEAFIPVKTLQGHQGQVSACCEISSFLFVSGDEIGRIVLTNPNNNFSPIAIYQVHSEKITAICSMEGSSFATSCIDGWVKIWETRRGRLELVLEQQVNPFANTLLGRKGEVIVGSMDGSLALWKTQLSFSLLCKWQGHENSVEHLLSHSSGHIVSACSEGTLKIWDPRQGYTHVTTICEQEEVILTIEERNDGSLQVLYADGTIKSWMVPGGKFIESTSGLRPPSLLIKSLSNGLIATGENQSIRLWHPNLSSQENDLKFYLELLEQHPSYQDATDYTAKLTSDNRFKAHLFFKTAHHFLENNEWEKARDSFEKAFYEFPDAPFSFYRPYLAMLNKEERYNLCLSLVDAYKKKDSQKDLIPIYRTLLSIKMDEAYFDALISCYQRAGKDEKKARVTEQLSIFMSSNRSAEMAKEESQVKRKRETELEKELDETKKRCNELEEILQTLQQSQNPSIVLL